MSRKLVGASLRADVQYLRAFAVLAVVVYHYWPKLLPGGFVGVDVFFAISGFLITEHLLREYRTKGRINVLGFWARRIRRLLPASLVTIAVSTALTLTLVPKNFTQQFLDELFASTFYFENWQLAANSVDYLAADNTPSPVQHFWSLGVEEQFYLVWPLVLVLCILVATLVRLKNKRVMMLVGVSAIVVFSLGASITETNAGLPSAYFETTTRAWQLALGALLALSLLTDVRKNRVVLTVGRVVGWAGLAYTVYAFNGSTPFPGFTAALPVLSTLLVIAMKTPAAEGEAAAPTEGEAAAGNAAAEVSSAPKRSLALLRPFRFIGDISYSIYLWHWPLLILVPFIRGQYLSDASRILVFAAAILFGFLSKRFVEDPFRKPRVKRGLTPLTFVAAAGAMAILAAVIVPAQSQIAALAQDSKNEGMRLYAIGTRCFGAKAWSASTFECKSNGLDRNFVTPNPQTLKNDLPVDFERCQAGGYAVKVTECVFGEKGGTRVALAGDSHIYMWLDAFVELAKTQHWEVHTFARGSCPFSHVLWPRKVAYQTKSCEIWNTNLDALLAKQPPYKLLFTSLRSTADTPPGSDPAATALAGFKKSWMPLIARGTKVVAIRDVPRPSGRQASCALKHPTHLKLCFTKYGFATMQTDWLYKSIESVEGTARIDMTEFFCRNKACPDVIGHTFIYRDESHVSATYVRTLTPMLAKKLLSAGVIR